MVRAKAAYAGKANPRIRRVHETRRDLGPSRIKLEARALDLSTERAEGVRAHANSQVHPPVQILPSVIGPHRVVRVEC